MRQIQKVQYIPHSTIQLLKVKVGINAKILQHIQLKYHCIIINNSLRSCLFATYVDLNTKCSEGYRHYSSDVPKYLHNKPRLFVNHCRQRIISAVEVEPQHVKEVCNGKEGGQFQVQSQSSNTCTACLLVLGMSCHNVAVLVFATLGSYASISIFLQF